MARLSRFVIGFIECGFWLDSNECGADWSIADLSRDDLRQIEHECDAFQESASHLLEDVDGLRLTKIAKKFGECGFIEDDEGAPDYFSTQH